MGKRHQSGAITLCFRETVSRLRRIELVNEFGCMIVDDLVSIRITCVQVPCGKERKFVKKFSALEEVERAELRAERKKTFG